MSPKILLLSILVSACGGASHAPDAIVKAEAFNGSGGQGIDAPLACPLPIVGTFQNQADGLIMTIAERDGECGITLSCGMRGFIYELGTNYYMMLADTHVGDSIGSCAFRAQGTSSSDGKRSGPYNNFNFGYYGISGWLGYALPGQINNNSGNIWSKL